MVIDEMTKRNLELTQSLFEQSKRGSLFWLLDQPSLGWKPDIEAMVKLSADRLSGRSEAGWTGSPN